MRRITRQFSTVALALAALVTSSQANAYEPRHVFITNRGGGNIVELNETFDYERVWFDGMLIEGSELNAPNGMAFTPNGSLFVADTFNDRIIAFDRDGVFLRAFSTATRLDEWVESLYFNAEGVLFATANPGNGVIARYQQSGAALPDVLDDPSFSALGNVNLTAAGLLMVADFSNMGRGLRELIPDTGVVVRTFGTDLGLQEDVMIDGADRVFVSHLGGDEVVVFGPAPGRDELFRFTAPATSPLPLVRPTGIALTHDCYILVASAGNGAIFIFRHGGDEPPTFERTLRPGEEIPPSAELSVTESISISALNLPGSFTEFADRVPSCEPVPPAPDAGPAPDSGIGVDAGADVGVDAGSRDAALDASPTGESSGCGCEVVGASSSGAARLGVAVLFLFGVRRRIGARSFRSGSGRASDA